MKPNNSQVMAQEKEKNVESSAFFSTLMERSILALPGRSQEILRDRFGIAGAPHTLEKIGGKYRITRERVRQIIREALKRVRQQRDLALVEAEEKITFTVRSHSGIMKESDLLDVLAKQSVGEQGALRFFLECVKGLKMHRADGDLEQSVSLDDFDLAHWRNVVQEAKKVLAIAKNPLVIEDLAGKIVIDTVPVAEQLFSDFLAVAATIKKNHFGKWGLSEWSEISPKGAREKAFAVLKESGKPLHFRVIAELIDRYYPGKKKTHPQTVHNELIKDNRFVLVGRCIYALEQWGFRRGTVKDVIEEILSRHGEPMDRREIIKEILKVRQVKRTTIMINLNNFFSRAGKDRYALKN